MTLSTKIWI